MYLDVESSSDQEEMTGRYYDASSPEEMNKLTESDIRHESDDAERQVQEEEEEEEEFEEQYFDAYSHEEPIRQKRLISNMFLVEESSSDKEEMTGRYYDAFSPEEMNKLTESDMRHESDNAERQVQEEEEEEEFEEQYFDAYSHEELIRQKTILSIRIVGQKLKNGECKESSADIWIPPNERIGSKSENHEDSHISKVSVNVDRYINNFDTFLAEETNSEKGTEPSVEQQSENSENSSVAVGIFSDQRMEESIDTEMSESQSKMHNPECPCFEDQETLLGKRTPFYNNLTESQDDTDNSENSSSVEEEEEKYFDSNLLKEYEKQPIYRQVSKQPAEVEPVIGGRKQTGNEFNNFGRDKGLVLAKVNARYRRNAVNCRVFVNIEEYISPMSDSKQTLSTIAIQVAGYGNSLDLVNIFGKTFHKYGWYLGLIRTKVDAKYLRNVANCRLFVRIEEYILLDSESKQILQKAMVIVAACKISFCITKSGNSTKSLHGVKKSIHQKEEHVMFFYCFAKFEVIIPGERITVSARFQAVISEYEHKWLTVFGGLYAELMQPIDKSNYRSVAYGVVKTRSMIYHIKCSTVGEKNVITERIYRVKTYKEGVGNNNRCIGTNSGTSPNYPDDTNDARKIQNIENQRTDIKEDKKIERFGKDEEKELNNFEEIQKKENQGTDVKEDKKIERSGKDEEKELNNFEEIQKKENQGTDVIQKIEKQRTDIVDGITDDKEDKKIERSGKDEEKNLNNFEEIQKEENQGTDIKEAKEIKEITESEEKDDKETEKSLKIWKVENPRTDVITDEKEDKKIEKSDEIQKIKNQRTDEDTKENDEKDTKNFEEKEDKKKKKTEEKEGKELKESEDVHDRKRRGSAKSKKEIPVEKNWRQRNDNWLFYDIELSKAILCVFFLVLHCPLANGNGNAEQEHKTDIGIFQHTLGKVSHCPNVSEHMKRASDKCAIVCGSYFPTKNCAYHCMRDSSKMSLVEFCAKPKVLFDFCPVYDLLGKRIQKDFSTHCNSTSSKRFYHSSDIFFCDPGNCLQLHDAGVSYSLTRLTTQATPINSRDIHDTWLSQHWYILLLLMLSVFAVFPLVYIFLKRKDLSACFRKIRKKTNRNDIEEGKEIETCLTQAQT